MDNIVTTLAQALLRRKELNGLLARVAPINTGDLFVARIKRTSAAEGFDDIVANVPRIGGEDVDAYYNWHARQLRELDAAIQRTNWETKVEIPASVMDDYVTKPFPEDKHEAAVPHT